VILPSPSTSFLLFRSLACIFSPPFSLLSSTRSPCIFLLSFPLSLNIDTPPFSSSDCIFPSLSPRVSPSHVVSRFSPLVSLISRLSSTRNYRHWLVSSLFLESSSSSLRGKGEGKAKSPFLRFRRLQRRLAMPFVLHVLPPFFRRRCTATASLQRKNDTNAASNFFLPASKHQEGQPSPPLDGPDSETTSHLPRETRDAPPPTRTLLLSASLSSFPPFLPLFSTNPPSKCPSSVLESATRAPQRRLRDISHPLNRLLPSQPVSSPLRLPFHSLLAAEVSLCV
jgi:hypothetical protein